MTNRAEAVVNLTAIKSNVAKLKAKAGVDLLAVVKADAYGHGLVPVAKAALEGGATWLGVALIEEAITLRAAGITAPILAWLVPPGSDFQSAVDNEIDIAVASLRALTEVGAVKGAKRPRVHLEVDTGMTRGGCVSGWSESEASE